MKKILLPLMVLVMVLGLALIPATPVGSAPADDELEVVLSDTGPGRLMYISGYGRTWAGLFHLSVDTEDCKGGEIYYGWCIDLDLPIRERQCFDANLVNAPRETPWCEIAYIMTHFSPTSNDEAGAIQLAIWKYIGGGQDSVVATIPQSVEDRADDIYEAAEDRSVNLFGPGLGLMPLSEGDGGSGYQVFTTTIIGSGCLNNIEVTFTTNAGSFSSTDPLLTETTVLTGTSGEASATLYWDTSDFSATITASTDGEWPVIIQPWNPRIQRTVILKPFGLSVERQFQEEPCEGSIEIKKVDEAGVVINLAGATFEVDPNPYGDVDPLTVVDNDTNDKDSTLGIILLQNVPADSYIVTETVAPSGYKIDPTPQPVNITCDEEYPITITFTNTRESDCIGLTPGYWKNWRNHYSRRQFCELLDGTIADCTRRGCRCSIWSADRIFAWYNASPGNELTILKAHLLAAQLTLNLGSLSEGCPVPVNCGGGSVGDAIGDALDILDDPDAYTREQILEVKDILDCINNMGGD